MQVELQGLSSTGACMCIYIYICLRVCLCFKALGEAPGCTLLSGVRWCWVWIGGGGAHTCYRMIYGGSVPPCIPVPVAYSVSAWHTMMHTHLQTHTTPAPPPRDMVWIISSFAMVRLDQCMNICTMMNCTAPERQPCSVRPQSRAHREEWPNK